MNNRVLISGDGGKAKELVRLLASSETQVIMPIGEHDFEIREDERRKFLTWLISEVAFDCYTCPVTVCFYDKNAKCVDELIKKYKEQCSEPIIDKFNEGRQQS